MGRKQDQSYQQIHRLAEFLDFLAPGWWERIDTERMTLEPFAPGNLLTQVVTGMADFDRRTLLCRLFPARRIDKGRPLQEMEARGKQMRLWVGPRMSQAHARDILSEWRRQVVRRRHPDDLV